MNRLEFITSLLGVVLAPLAAFKAKRSYKLIKTTHDLSAGEITSIEKDILPTGEYIRWKIPIKKGEKFQVPRYGVGSRSEYVNIDGICVEYKAD